MNIFLTGHTNGLGRGLLEHALEMGHKLWCLSRSSSQKTHPNLNESLCDLSTTSFDQLNELLINVPPIDLVILNAGVLGEIKDLSQFSDSELKKVFEVNFFSQKLLLDVLLTRDVHRVLGISTGAILKSQKGWGPYSMSKNAFKSLLEFYALEFPRTHFLSLAPGIIKTNMQEKILNVDTENYQSFKRLQEANLSGQMPTPNQSAALIFDHLETYFQTESGGYTDVRNY